jgi:hypothetical protein
VVVLAITGMVAGFETGEYIPVFDVGAPADDQVIETEADFEIHDLAEKLRDFRKRGGTEEGFRELLAERWPSYANVAFPDRKAWLYRQEAEALVELGIAEPVVMGEIEDALEAWGL